MQSKNRCACAMWTWHGAKTNGGTNSSQLTSSTKLRKLESCPSKPIPSFHHRTITPTQPWAFPLSHSLSLSLLRGQIEVVRGEGVAQSQPPHFISLPGPTGQLLSYPCGKTLDPLSPQRLLSLFSLFHLLSTMS